MNHEPIIKFEIDGKRFELTLSEAKKIREELTIVIIDTELNEKRNEINIFD